MIFKFKLNSLFTLSASVLLTACANIPSNTEASEVTVTEPVTAAIPKQELSGQSLFQLFLAEIATNRREYVAAAALYSEIGANYNDVTALQRAIALNQSIGDYNRMYPLAQKWLELRPQESEALKALSLAAIATGQIEHGAVSLDQWLILEPKADISIILPGVDKLNSEQRIKLTEELKILQENHTNSASLDYTQARLKYSASATDEALALANTSLSKEENLHVALFKFQLLLNLEQAEEAKKLIESLSNDYSTNRQVGIQHTRFIYRYEPSNLAALKDLHTRFSTEPTIARTYAHAAFDQQEFDSAKAVYLHLLKQGYSDEAHYFLGRIDLINEMADSAADHFEAVKQAPYLTSAIAEWVAMARIIDNSRIASALDTHKKNQPDDAPMIWRLESSYYQLTEQNDQAWKTLSQAIELFPSNIPLLYDQAMFAATLDRFSVMENNLIAILELEPENINALNALGYTWADLNKNLETASSYIDRALKTDPNNPAFQDSKGWILYRTGKLEEALVWLKKAYASMENDEVAAHIAEVLWYLKQQVEARNFLNEVVRLNPDSEYAVRLNELFNE